MAHLTSHSMMPDARLSDHTIVVIRLLNLFCVVHLCILATSSQSPVSLVRALPSVSFIVSIFARNVPFMAPIFLKRSLVIPIFADCIELLHLQLKR